MICIGADGGGTGTTLAAFENGVRIAEAEAGPLNYRFMPPEDAARSLREGIRALGLTEEQTARVLALGIADPSLDDAADTQDEAAARFYRILRRAVPWPVYGRSDAYVTLFGLTGGNAPGTLIVSGTGAMGIARNEKAEIRVAGGWGRLTGDEGSGYFIASEGIRAALRAADGVKPPTLLTDALTRYFGASSPRGLIPILYGDPEPDIASFAVEVDRCADQGDPEALRILGEAASWLAAYASGLVRWSGSRLVGIYGSVLTKNARVRSAFEAALSAEVGGVDVVLPPIPAEEAAARYAEACALSSVI